MNSGNKAIFWKRLSEIRAGMLIPDGADPRPMAHAVRSEDNAMFFVVLRILGRLQPSLWQPVLSALGIHDG